MIAALWSNSNWDDDKGTRKRVINDLTNQHEEAIMAIEAALNPKPVLEDEKIDDENPFFAAAERGLQKIEVASTKVKEAPKAEEDEEIDYMRGLDQE